MDSNKLGIDYQYVILDDDADMLYEQRNNFVWCDSLKGITKIEMELAISILNNISPVAEGSKMENASL